MLIDDIRRWWCQWLWKWTSVAVPLEICSKFSLKNVCGRLLNCRNCESLLPHTLTMQYSVSRECISGQHRAQSSVNSSPSSHLTLSMYVYIVTAWCSLRVQNMWLYLIHQLSYCMQIELQLVIEVVFYEQLDVCCRHAVHTHPRMEGLLHVSTTRRSSVQQECYHFWLWPLKPGGSYIWTMGMGNNSLVTPLHNIVNGRWEVHLALPLSTCLFIKGMR